MLLLFLTAQGLDGLFTYAAVNAYGLHAEGNVLIAAGEQHLEPRSKVPDYNAVVTVEVLAAEAHR